MPVCAENPPRYLVGYDSTLATILELTLPASAQTGWKRCPTLSSDV
jgi:hypothetical protein